MPRGKAKFETMNGFTTESSLSVSPLVNVDSHEAPGVRDMNPAASLDSGSLSMLEDDTVVRDVYKEFGAGEGLVVKELDDNLVVGLGDTLVTLETKEAPPPPGRPRPPRRGGGKGRRPPRRRHGLVDGKCSNKKGHEEGLVVKELDDSMVVEKSFGRALLHYGTRGAAAGALTGGAYQYARGKRSGKDLAKGAVVGALGGAALGAAGAYGGERAGWKLNNIFRRKRNKVHSALMKKYDKIPHMEDDMISAVKRAERALEKSKARTPDTFYGSGKSDRYLKAMDAIERRHKERIRGYENYLDTVEEPRAKSVMDKYRRYGELAVRSGRASGVAAGGVAGGVGGAALYNRTKPEGKGYEESLIVKELDDSLVVEKSLGPMLAGALGGAVAGGSAQYFRGKRDARSIARGAVGGGAMGGAIGAFGHGLGASVGSRLARRKYGAALAAAEDALRRSRRGYGQLADETVVGTRRAAKQILGAYENSVRRSFKKGDPRDMLDAINRHSRYGLALSNRGHKLEMRLMSAARDLLERETARDVLRLRRDALRGTTEHYGALLGALVGTIAAAKYGGQLRLDGKGYEDYNAMVEKGFVVEPVLNASGYESAVSVDVVEKGLLNRAKRVLTRPVRSVSRKVLEGGRKAKREARSQFARDVRAGKLKGEEHARAVERTNRTGDLRRRIGAFGIHHSGKITMGLAAIPTGAGYGGYRYYKSKKKGYEDYNAMVEKGFVAEPVLNVPDSDNSNDVVEKGLGDAFRSISGRIRQLARRRTPVRRIAARRKDAGRMLEDYRQVRSSRSSNASTLAQAQLLGQHRGYALRGYQDDLVSKELDDSLVVEKGMLGGVLRGAAIGGISGSLFSKDSPQTVGFWRGAVAGALIGSAVGSVPHLRHLLKSRKDLLELKKRYEAVVRLPGSNLSKQAKELRAKIDELRRSSTGSVFDTREIRRLEMEHGRVQSRLNELYRQEDDYMARMRRIKQNRFSLQPSRESRLGTTIGAIWAGGSAGSIAQNPPWRKKRSKGWDGEMVAKELDNSLVVEKGVEQLLETPLRVQVAKFAIGRAKAEGRKKLKQEVGIQKGAISSLVKNAATSSRRRVNPVSKPTSPKLSLRQPKQPNRPTMRLSRPSPGAQPVRPSGVRFKELDDSLVVEKGIGTWARQGLHRINPFRRSAKPVSGVAREARGSVSTAKGDLPPVTSAPRPKPTNPKPEPPSPEVVRRSKKVRNTVLVGGTGAGLGIYGTASIMAPATGQVVQAGYQGSMETKGAVNSGFKKVMTYGSGLGVIPLAAVGLATGEAANRLQDARNLKRIERRETRERQRRRRAMSINKTK